MDGSNIVALHRPQDQVVKMTAPAHQVSPLSGDAMFEENILRVRLICNSLKAFVAEEPKPRTSVIEAREIARFLNQDLHGLMQSIAKFHEALIHRRPETDYARKAAIELLREDHARLISLSANVAGLLQPVFRGRKKPDMDQLRAATSSFLAALNNYLDWLIKFTVEESVH